MSNVLHKFSKLTNFSTTLLCKHGHTNLCHDKYTGGGASYSVVKLSHALKTNGTMPGIESYNIPVNKVEKFHKWATYTLIDVKLVFIMAYVYVSVVNLISTTATNEANDDTENSAPVNISARQGHTNVIVTYIDDSILWNCREYSPSDDYYRTLYWMLVSVFSATLAFFCISKIFALYNIGKVESLSDLWNIAVMQHLKKATSRINYKSEAVKNFAKLYQGMLDKGMSIKFFNEIKTLANVKRRRVLSFMPTILLSISIPIGALSYDLHPLSCIAGVSEDNINYNTVTQTVEMKFSNAIINFQRVAVLCILILIGSVFPIAYVFYRDTRTLVNKMETEVDRIIKITDEVVPEKIYEDIPEKTDEVPASVIY